MNLLINTKTFLVFNIYSNKEICIFLGALKPLTYSLPHSHTEPQSNYEAPEW